MNIVTVLLMLMSYVWPLAIIGVVVYLIMRKRANAMARMGLLGDRTPLIALNREDLVSQLFFLLSLFFFGSTLYGFNRDLGSPFEWMTILLVTALAGMAGSYSFKVLYMLPFSLIGLAGWWTWKATRWIDTGSLKWAAVITGLSFVTLLLYVAARIHNEWPKFRRFSHVYYFLGFVPLVVLVFFFSTKYGLEAIGEMTKGTSIFGSWQMSASLIFFGLSLLAALMYVFRRGIMPSGEAAAVLFLALLFLSFTILTEQEMVIGSSDEMHLTGLGILYALVINATAFFGLLGVIFSGYARREEWLINWGSFLLFILIIIKYTDWFFTFMDKSFFFIIAGFLLFFVGWFMEDGRRRVIMSMKKEKGVSGGHEE